MPTVGERIAAARRESKMTRTQLARAAGLSPGAISRIEREERVPWATTLAQIARALEVDAGTLVDVPNDGLARAAALEPTTDGHVIEAIQLVAQVMPTLPPAGRERVLRILRAALD